MFTRSHEVTQGTALRSHLHCCSKVIHELIGGVGADMLVFITDVVARVCISGMLAFVLSVGKLQRSQVKP